MRRFDVLFVADPRFEGGVTTAMAVEMREAARAGLSAGLMMVRGPIIRHSFPTHPEIAAAIDAGVVARVDPEEAVTAPLVLVHHPSILRHPFSPRPKVKAGVVVVVLHHPMRNAAGVLQYDLADLVLHARMAFGRPPVLAPVSSVVRRSLPVEPPAGASISGADWENLIELDGWRPRPPRDPALGDRSVTIGRHSRPDPQKWPDEVEDARLAYPTPDDWRVRILGGGDYLAALYEETPPEWELIPFNGEGVADFLASLDVWVYFHSKAWSEAFGRTTLEAMASGVPVILDPLFRPLFGDAALYARPAEVEETVRTLTTAPGAWAARAEAGRRFVEECFGARRFGPRVAPLIEEGSALVGREAGPAATRPAGPPPKPVLFLSSNGIGVGHLVQQLAIADRLPGDLKPVFATLSYAASVAADAGYPTEYLPGPSVGGFDHRSWNDQIAETLLELMIRLRPRVVLLDSTAPFEGMLRALEVHREAFTIWVRRPLWQEVHRPFAEAFWRFDAVIEPGELAAGFDHGATVAQRVFAFRVPPVLQHAPDRRLSRAEARRQLGLPEDATVVAMQLGGGNNYPLGSVRERIAEEILARPDTLLLEIRSPIRAAAPEPDPEHPRHRAITLFPCFPLSRAFDAAVLAAGYNAFHEAIAGGIPTLFVPNEGPEMDMQVNRAIWADLAGCGLVCRRDLHRPRIAELVARLLDPAERAEMAARARLFAPADNGADAIARFVADSARLVRADRSPAVRS